MFVLRRQEMWMARKTLEQRFEEQVDRRGVHNRLFALEWGAGELR